MALTSTQASPAASIYLSSGDKYPVSDIGSLVGTLVEASTDDPVMLNLFIHGRGGGKLRHPEKALTKMVPALEAEYGLKVILFNWHGSGDGGRFGFPVENARAASVELLKVFKQLEEIKKSASKPKIELTILTHSMGSLVLEETVRRYADELPVNLAEAVLISAPASRRENHANWLELSKVGRDHYVIVNSSDKALWFVNKILRRSPRLGQGLRKARQASNARYIDLSGAGVNHRYFIARTNSGGMSGQNKNNCIGGFYKHVLTNTPYNMEQFFTAPSDPSSAPYSIHSRNHENCR